MFPERGACDQFPSEGDHQQSDMKLIIFLSMAAVVACDYPAAEPPAPSDSYGAPIVDADAPEEHNPSPSAAPLEPTRSFFGLKNFYHGAFPPVTLPPTNFLSKATFPSQFSFKYPFRTYNYAPLASSPQGILPPISQILPPLPQIVPPVLGGAKPTLPVNPSQILPPQIFPPSIPTSVLPSQPTTLFASHFPKYASTYSLPSYYRPLSAYPYFNSPYAVFPPTPFFPVPLPKEPSQAQQESPSTSYGPPSPTASESSAPFEPAGQAENSAPFEPSPVSFPYEPAAPEPADPAPHTPAQEYGLPSKK